MSEGAVEVGGDDKESVWRERGAGSEERADRGRGLRLEAGLT